VADGLIPRLVQVGTLDSGGDWTLGVKLTAKYGRETETAYRISKGVCQGINRERKCADTIGTVPGLAISNDKMKIYFPNKIYGSNFIKQHSETVMV